MKAHKSALKHGSSEDAGIYAAEHHVYVADLDDDNPARQFRLDFDPNGRLLESVVLRFDSGNELLIHAMTARPQYVDLL
ncbi:toxin [Rhodococcus sp. KBW08]|uniref:toxin n=1 Tax=Rhodococcus sp. KBW08 TaxID=2144188 RepID=UPI000F5A5706|nr:toxin [Rhodococcus sp. KBW08]RQO40038.1 toxin [Rhodococcus sp. KBW08]